MLVQDKQLDKQEGDRKKENQGREIFRNACKKEEEHITDRHLKNRCVHEY